MTVDKTTLLDNLHTAIAEGSITRQDVEQLFPAQQTSAPISAQSTSRLSAVDIMFYIAGAILYAALLSVLAQTWQDNSPMLRILLSVGMASGLWALAYYLARSSFQNDIRKGLTNSLLLTGSLAAITGAYIVVNEMIGGYGNINFFGGAVALLATGLLHIVFDKYIKRDILLIIGTLLCVLAVPAVLFGVIDGADLPVDVWSGILVFSAVLLAFAARVVSRLHGTSRLAPSAFDSFAAFVGLGAVYIATYGDNSFVWFLLLVASILGIFYASILMQNKHLLGSASFFLVISIITISFRYFSDFGVSISLVLATIGLLGSAAAASTINKKYFK